MNKQKVFFIGICGIGMSGLAILAKRKGFDVEGSDIAQNYITQKLKQNGIKVYKGHSEKLIDRSISFVVVSSAIKSNNPQIKKAKDMKINVLNRAEFLAYITRNMKVIAVSGCHGKTTTSGMLSAIFYQAQMNFSAVIGGIAKHIDSHSVYFGDEYCIIEADESDGSFLNYSPLVECITNIDNDHLDYYKDMNNIMEAFIKFINKVPFYGRAVLCGDDKNIRSILKYITSPVYTYGFDYENDWTCKIISANEFVVYYRGKKEDKIKLGIFGKHNILNALASYVCARYVGIERKSIINGLERFSGIKRRIELIRRIKDVLFYDDYAHHPSEIKATLSTIRSIYPGYKIIVIFQPHRYSRTYYLLRHFTDSFDYADMIYICDIYPAGEKNIYGISSNTLISELSKKHRCVFKWKDALTVAKEILPKTIVISLGAGDVYKILDEVIVKYELFINDEKEV